MMKAGGTEIGKTLAEKSRGLFSANDWQCKTYVDRHAPVYVQFLCGAFCYWPFFSASHLFPPFLSKYVSLIIKWYNTCSEVRNIFKKPFRERLKYMCIGFDYGGNLVRKGEQELVCWRLKQHLTFFNWGWRKNRQILHCIALSNTWY